MRTHQASARLQEKTCAVLLNLAYNDRMRECIKVAGGVEFVKRAVSASDARHQPRTGAKGS